MTLRTCQKSNDNKTHLPSSAGQCDTRRRTGGASGDGLSRCDPKCIVVENRTLFDHHDLKIKHGILVKEYFIRARVLYGRQALPSCAGPRYFRSPTA